MISFTGSTQVGRLVARTAGEQLKKVELELGGKNPQLVMADADLDAAVDAVVFGVYFNAGECCNSGSRVLVERSIAERLPGRRRRRGPSRCRSATRSIRRPRSAPSPARSSSTPSSATSPRAAPRARAWRWAASGWPPRPAASTRPTVFTGVSPDMSIAREEIFGPVLSDADLRHPGRGDPDRQLHRRSACPPASGPATSTPRCWPRARSAPGRSGSTAGWTATRSCRSAASARAGSAVSSAARRSTSSPRPRPSSCRSARGRLVAVHPLAQEH